MSIDPVALAALAKFNQNKNASHFPTDIEPGTYPVDLKISLLGTVKKGMPGVTRRRNDSGSKHIARFLLDHATPSTIQYLLDNLPEIRKGNFTVFDSQRLEKTMNLVMPYREIPRQGSTRFDGELILEDVDLTPEAIPETTTGLRVIAGDK